MLAPISRSPSYSLLSSAPDMCATAEGEDCTNAALRLGKGEGRTLPLFSDSRRHHITADAQSQVP
jgi:hypothetical protein